MTCSKCGHNNKNKTAPFCSECGNKLNDETIKETEPPKKKRNVLTLSLLAIVSVAIITFSVFYFVGKAKFTPEKTVEAFQTAVKDKNYKAVEKMIQPFDDTFEINLANTKSMVDFLNANPSHLETLSDQFNLQIKEYNESKQLNNLNTNTYATIFLTQEGKKWLIFDDYHFSVVPAYIVLGAHTDGLDLYIDKEKVATSTLEFREKFGPYMLGDYTVKAAFKNDYASQEEVGEIELFETESEADPFIFEMRVDEVAVRTPYDDFNLYINDIETDFPVNNENVQKIGLFPLDGSVSLHVTRDLPWGQFTSEELVIESDSVVFEEVHPLTKEEQIELMEQLNSTLEQYISALSKNDPALLKAGVSDNLKDQLDEHIEKMSKRYSKTTGKIKEIRYNIDSISNPVFDEAIDAYTMTLETQLFIHETDGILYGWTNFGEDKERDATKFSRDFNIYYDEDKEQWLLDSTNTGYYFVFDRNAKVFEFN